MGAYRTAKSGPERVARDLERLLRNDASKGSLGETIATAAAAVSRVDPEGAALLSAMAEGLRECRRGRAFRDALCGNYTVFAKSCGVRLCPDCERARSGRLVARLSELVDDMDRAVFWTLTIPNVPRGALSDSIDVLQDAFRAIRRRAPFVGGACPSHGCNHPRRHRPELMAECRCGACISCQTCVHRSVAGGVYSIEVTWRPERGEWHPHLHALMDAPYITWAHMRDLWRAATCDAIRRAERRAAGLGGRVPHCAHPADDKGVASGGCRGASVVWVEAVTGEGEERRRAIRETLKYVSKGLLRRDGTIEPSAGPDELAELLLAIHRRRLVAGWGSFRHVKDDIDPPLDPDLYLVGPDVLPSLAGLPRRCPQCGAEAIWEPPVEVPRRLCRPLGNGLLSWRPPPHVH
ncbi:MAG: hypothetical protein V4515_07925 [Chloroflexota bacterium]